MVYHNTTSYSNLKIKIFPAKSAATGVNVWPTEYVNRRHWNITACIPRGMVAWSRPEIIDKLSFANQQDLGRRFQLWKYFSYDSVLIKERVHSEMKFSEKIKIDPNFMPFALFFSKSVSIPSNINSSPKISLPGTCIITSRDLHYCFWGPAFSLPGPALLLPELHYFTVTFPSKKIKQREGN